MINGSVGCLFLFTLGDFLHQQNEDTRVTKTVASVRIIYNLAYIVWLLSLTNKSVSGASKVSSEAVLL